MTNPATIQLNIRSKLLDKALEIKTLLGLPMDLPNVEASGAQTRLEALVFQNQPENYGWGSETVYQGILQINYVTAGHVGSDGPMTVCNQIVNFFKKGSDIWNGDLRIVVEETPAILTEIQEGNKTTWPVSIRYKSRPM